MGQYFRPVMEEKGKVICYETYLDGEYECCKLMEQSWYPNPYVNAVVSKIFKKPTKIAWVGDYSNSVKDDFPNIPVSELYEKAWKKGSRKRKSLKSNKFTLINKYLVNHDTKEFLDLNRYKKENTIDGWCTHPVSLLTAIGNGQGGGDFYTRVEHKEQIENVGKWAWNTLEIVIEKPENYHEVMFHFYED